MRSSGLIRATLLTSLFSAFLWLSWTGSLDQIAEHQIQSAFQRALLTFGVARGLNAVISVAQGTEIALQPAGVGITLTAGEILDPLNDLIERFSWLVLIATTSLGIQITLTEIFSTTGVNIAFTGVVLLCVACIWLCRTNIAFFSRRPMLPAYAVRLASVVMLIRFALAIVTFTAGFLSQLFLEQKQNDSMQVLSQTSSVIEQSQRTMPTPQSDSLVDRFSSFLEEQKQALDIESRIERLKNQAESAISHIVNLIVLYILETLLLPVVVLYLFHRAIRTMWRLLSPNSSL